MLNQPCYHAFRFIFKLLLMHIPAIVQQANGGPTKSMGRDEVFARIVANICEIMTFGITLHEILKVGARRHSVASKGKWS